MTTIRDITGYPTSDNAGALWDLALTESIICLVPYGRIVTGDDIAHTVCTDDGIEKTVAVSAKGICYLPASTRDEFILQCTLARLRWIIPLLCTSSGRAIHDSLESSTYFPGKIKKREKQV